jgi:hypothetical protein
MVWACDETRGTNAVRVLMKMNVEGKRGRDLNIYKQIIIIDLLLITSNIL